ncbi:MAG TPA: hypothetical protein VNK44_06270 [Candidatus Nitrosotenuis sp.]|nr:hypothetical protein [Candidatus Nitrosotenuis sp.]
MKILLTSIFVVLLTLTLCNPVSGLKSTYDILKPLKWGSPQVCILEPDYEETVKIEVVTFYDWAYYAGADPIQSSIEYKKILNKEISESILKETKSALDTWESLLKQRERSRDAQKNWDFDYKIITLEQQKTFDEKSCSIVIKFVPTPSRTNEMYRILGITENRDTQTADHRLIHVYYQKIGSCISHVDKHYIYYKPCYVDDVILAVQIGNTVRHEFGHALGLGHYYFADDPNMYWKDSTTPAPSIMTIFAPDLYDEQEIKQIDIEKVREIYGEKGFVKQVQSQTKTKNNIESQSDEVKTMKNSDTKPKKEKKNPPPIANFAYEGDIVTLLANTKSGDKISWKQISGPKVKLLSTTIAELSFVAPDVKKGQVEILTFRLTIKDQLGNTSTDKIKINILSRD